MTEKLNKVTAEAPLTERSLDEWREEIQAFFRQMMSHLQDIAREEGAGRLNKETPQDPTPPSPPPEVEEAITANKAAADKPASQTERKESSRADTSKPSHSASADETTNRNSKATQVSVPRDLDSSQDRLANLKKQLAAKLSKAASDDTSS